jgi:hypothetical protein
LEVITKQVIEDAFSYLTPGRRKIGTWHQEWAKSVESHPHPGAAVRKVYHEVYQNRLDRRLTSIISKG